MTPDPSWNAHDSFPSTRWSAIRPDGTDAGARRALEELARAYGSPIAAFLAQSLRGDRAAAQDATQDFLLWVLESGFLSKADPERGSFRAFLKTALRHHLADGLRHARAAKRGGERQRLPLEESGVHESACGRERSPDQAFDDAWRATVVARALERAREGLLADGKSRAWAIFEAYFLSQTGELDYAALAARHSIGTADVSNGLQLAKRRMLDALRSVVIETVRSGAELEAELDWLLPKDSPWRSR